MRNRVWIIITTKLMHTAAEGTIRLIEIWNHMTKDISRAFIYFLKYCSRECTYSSTMNGCNHPGSDCLSTYMIINIIPFLIPQYSRYNYFYIIYILFRLDCVYNIYCVVNMIRWYLVSIIVLQWCEMNNTYNRWDQLCHRWYP